jgi:beta-lactamase regulating signal transducer with metallopeptidase domain
MVALLLLKASALLAVSLLAAHLLRRAPAVSRHRFWTGAFTALLALPLLVLALPALPIPMWSCCAATPVAPPRDADSAAFSRDEDAAVSRANGPRTIGDSSRVVIFAHTPGSPSILTGSVRPSARGVLLTAWALGTLAATGALLLALVRVRRLAGDAVLMDDEAWGRSARALGARLGLRRPPRLLVSAAVGTPMAGGVWRPAIFLPSSARLWSDERRDVVLAHEIAHLAAHDPLRHLAARVAVALYWFHPLAWAAARRSTAAREQACDEAVLALGTRRAAYARVLLELAESMPQAAARSAALPMVQRTHLETRLMAILNDDVRAARQWPLAVPAVFCVLCTLVVAAAQPSVQASPVAVGAPAALVTAGAPPVATPVATPPATPPGPLAVPGVTAWRSGAISLQSTGDSACASDWNLGGSFSGYTSTHDTAGRTIVSEQMGTNGVDRVIQKSFGDVQACMLAEGAAADRTIGARPSQWIGRARRVVLETRRGRQIQRLEVRPGTAGQRIIWQVGGAERTFDTAAQQWRDRALAVLDTTWELSSLRGEVSSLRGEISSIRGQESSLRGEISSLHGEVSSMRGQQSSIRGDESSLQGQISSIRGHLSSLRGAISSEQGSISSLNAGGYRSDDATRMRDLITRHEREIARLEQEIRDYDADAKVAAVERDIKSLDSDGKVDAIESRIRAFDLDGKTAAVERRITALDVEAKITAIERQIAALDADRRARQLEDRRDQELKRLESAISAIR